MFNTILTYAGLPARWIVHALGFPESLQYTPYFLANLVVVVTLLFSWYCWLVWLRHRYVFYLFLYLVSVAAAVVGFFATISYRHAWVYACVWITLGFVFFVSTQRSRRLAASVRRLFRRFFAVAVICSLAFPIVYSLRQEQVRSRVTGEAGTSLQGSINRTGIQSQQLADLTDTLSSDATLLESLAPFQTLSLTSESGQAAARRLTTYLQSLQTTHTVGAVTVTDPLANVIGRSNQPDRRGDNLFETQHWTVPLFTACTATHGVAFTDQGVPVLVAGRCLRSGDTLLGTLLVSRTLDQSWLEGEQPDSLPALALGNRRGILVTTVLANTSEQRILRTTDVQRNIQDVASTLNRDATWAYTLRVGQATYYLTGFPFPVIGSTPLWLFTVQGEPNLRWFTALDLALTFGAGLIIVQILSWGKRVVIRRPSESDEATAEITITRRKALPGKSSKGEAHG